VPTLWPTTQVLSWVSHLFFCIIGLTSMLLPQGCVDPSVSGDGQTVSYQPHIHANIIRSSQEQHHSPIIFSVFVTTNIALLQSLPTMVSSSLSSSA
jgi:hypothetical protein